MIDKPVPEEARKEFERMQNPEIVATDLEGNAPEVGATKIIMQRHEKYVRGDDEGQPLGSLTEESAEKAYQQSRRIVEQMLDSIEDDLDEIDFLVVGSSTQYKGKGQRSRETAQQALQALRDVLEERGVDGGQILNNRSKAKDVATITRMRVDRIFNEWPEYAAFLEDKYGNQTQKFWQAFEEDWHPYERRAFGAEGPDEMDERFASYIKTLAKFSGFHHSKHQDRRLVLWSVSHYDTVSPYIKRHITMTDPNQYVAVDYGAGINIDIDPDGNPTCDFRGKKYEVSL